MSHCIMMPITLAWTTRSQTSGFLPTYDIVGSNLTVTYDIV